MFNKCLFHLCDCTCSNVMCVCSTICGSNQKDFCSFCLLLEVICITHVFQSFSSFFVWKACFLGVFVTYFMCKFNHELKGPILKFFQLWIESFTTVSRVSLTSEILVKFLQEAYLWNDLRNFSWVSLTCEIVVKLSIQSWKT